MSQSSGALCWKESKVTEGGLCFPPSRRLKGDHGKLQPNSFCMLMGMPRTLELGFSKKGCFEWNRGWFQCLLSKPPFANTRCEPKVLWSRRFGCQKCVLLSQTDWPPVQLHAHHISTGSHGTSLLLHAYSACITQNHAIVVEDWHTHARTHTVCNMPKACRTFACTRTFYSFPVGQFFTKHWPKHLIITSLIHALSSDFPGDWCPRVRAGLGACCSLAEQRGGCRWAAPAQLTLNMFPMHWGNLPEPGWSVIWHT